MEKTYCSITIGKEVANISNEFELNNSELKRKYLVLNIQLYNAIVAKINGSCGSFGTGYPFYVLDNDLKGQLPVIDEQIRYNNELASEVLKSDRSEWVCCGCMNEYNLPDLKQICKPCTNMDNALKPRKILNRLPDIDMWMVCEDDQVDEAKDQLVALLNEHRIYPSDISPVQTVGDLAEIVDDIKTGVMPNKFLPIDTHVVSYSTMYSLIRRIPFVLEKALRNGEIPYLPIHPISYRKKWQHDDEAYNFVHDYLSSLTEFGFQGELKQLLFETRYLVSNSCSVEQLYNTLITTGPPSVKSRHKTIELKKVFEERVSSWKN